MINLPNSHLQYAITWYGLAAALAGVMGGMFYRRSRPV
jgi:surfeit locus 1 family protein